MENDLVMYLVVRESLGMSIGKTAAQCAHVSQMLMEEYYYLRDRRDYHDLNEKIKFDKFEEWFKSDYRKVVLRADEKEWVKLKELNDKEIVKDNGLTELAPGTETVIGFMPMRKSEVPKLIKRLQVLK